MKWTQAFEVAPGFFENHGLADIIDDIYLGFDFLNWVHRVAVALYTNRSPDDHRGVGVVIPVTIGVDEKRANYQRFKLDLESPLVDNFQSTAELLVQMGNHSFPEVVQKQPNDNY